MLPRNGSTTYSRPTRRRSQLSPFVIAADDADSKSRPSGDSAPDIIDVLMAEASDSRPIQGVGDGQETRRVPKWSRDPFGDFLDHTERLSQVLHLTIHGISILV